MSKTYTRPSFNEVKRMLEADLEKLPAVIREALVPPLAKVDHGQHGHLDWIRRQISPLTCDEEMLHDWAMVYKVPKLLATFGEGAALAKGNWATQLLVGTMLRGQNGLDYKVIEQAVMGLSETRVQIRCLSAGADSNMEPGQTLTLIDPVPGIESTLVVADPGIQGGADDETVDFWRDRIVDEWRTVTSEGARSGRPRDYKFWARSAHPSVTGALVYPHALGRGTVLVMPICNSLPNRLPTQPVMDAVKLYISNLPPDYDGVAPATADVKYGLHTPTGVQVILLLDPEYDTDENRAKITGALTAALMVEADEGSVFKLAEIDAAIATVTNQYTRIAPIEDITVQRGQVLILLPVQWERPS